MRVENWMVDGGNRQGASGREQWSLRSLACQFLERLRQMISVVEEKDAPGALAQEKGEERNVGLFCVAAPAREDEVVRPVIGGLPLAGPHVVEGDFLGIGLGAAIGTDRTMPLDQPLPVGLIGAPTGTAKLIAGCRRRGCAPFPRRSAHKTPLSVYNPGVSPLGTPLFDA